MLGAFRENTVRVGTCIALLSVSGCGKLLGADEYVVVTTDASQPASAVDPTDASEPASAGTFLAGESCSRCLDEGCSGYLDACAASPTCPAFLECRRSCRDPACHFDCLATYGGAYGSIGFVGISDAGFEMSELTDCAYKGCSVECNVGRDFACRCDYEANVRPPSDDTFDVAFDVRASRLGAEEWPRVTGVRVGACNEPSGGRCEPGTVRAEVVSSGGAAELSWPMEGRPGFDGHFLFDDERADAGGSGLYEGPFPRALWSSTLPFVDGSHYVWAFPTRNLLDLGLASVDGGWDPARSSMYVQVSDCNLFGAWGLELEVTEGGDERTRVQYFDEMGYPQPQSMLTQTVNGGVSIDLVPADQQVTLTARHPDTGQVVARARRFLQADVWYRLELQPLRKSEVDCSVAE